MDPYNQQGYPPQHGYPPPPPNAYPPEGYPPQYPPPQYQPQPGYPPQPQPGYPPPPGYAPQGYAQPGYPPPNMQPNYQQPPTSIIAIAPAPVRPVFGPNSTLAFCDHCKVNVSTHTVTYVGCMVWLMFFIFLFFSPIISCLPFCIRGWYDIGHNCPKCSRRLGMFTPL
ncbi:hypothetical protein SteCoe_25017 [Stentor coeruleus]|uniref:LITAF domain-containing protein n=1 Tax=Stentor coeruleus TaxID=5963 RepID=A0A1R2BG54_9CILI|nr:hypothetical protein SteCoe_25017 [Stentor coeruleus]